MARYFCRLFSLAHLFLFGKNISQTQDINPELGTLGHILVTAIIISVRRFEKAKRPVSEAISKEKSMEC